jgi:diaminohydroxyphosphoribosylaminopyrimidine deaminase / 5-amino-6-(5-phosphoribosylamino)uracil reductase
MDYMNQAIALAKLAMGQVSPNPAVGAVIVKNDAVIGQGYTQPPGEAHAEVVALRQAGVEARGATMYVTLEPCCHHGRTPPCTKAIIEAGISQVHVAMLDPNPQVAGKGTATLENAGIQTYLGEAADEAAEIIEAYVKYITTGMPFVAVKFAISLDGKTATRTGDSQWISGEESRRFVHNMRYVCDAVMAGVNTVLADDPRLTARVCGGLGGTARRQPLRVIIDSNGRTPPTAKLFKQPGEVLLVTAHSLDTGKKEALVAAGAEVLELPSQGGRVDLDAMLKELAKREITSVMVEGGGVLAGSFFDSNLVDKVVAFITPIIVGGAEANTPVAGNGVSSIAMARRLENIRVYHFGDDIMISGYPREGNSCSPVSSKK